MPLTGMDPGRTAVAEIIDLERFRSKVAADQGFRSWLARFQEQFGPDTRLQDLSPSTLLYLATPGEENLFVFFDLVMGAQGLGGSLRFRLDDLDNDVKMKIMDTAFGMVDRVRFEVMRRLGWIAAAPAAAPIIDLVRQAWRQGDGVGQETPVLAPEHPDYLAYARLNAMDRAVFLRRLIPRAVGTFREQVEHPTPD
jgi:hypothetical protein